MGVSRFFSFSALCFFVNPWCIVRIPQNLNRRESVVEGRETDFSFLAFGAVVSVHCAQMEEESARHKIEDVQGEEFQLSDEIVRGQRVQEPENNEYPKDINIGGDDSGGNSSSEDSKPEEKSPEFVEEEKLEKKLEEVCEYVLQAVENPVENLVVPDVPEVVESGKIEEKLTQAPDDCNGTSPVVAVAVSNGTEETKLAAEEEKKEEVTGVVDLVSKGNLDDLLQEAAEFVPATEPKAIEPQIPESRAYEIAALDTRTVAEQREEPEIPESTGYQVSALDLYSTKNIFLFMPEFHSSW